MRFRLAEWDVSMPDALVDYWTAWNTSDIDRVRGLLERAVTHDVEWNDPRDSFVGIDELERAIAALRSSKPDYEFAIASEIDRHHDRLRYRWDMHRRGRTLMEGLDIVTLAPSGLIERVDGFFARCADRRAFGVCRRETDVRGRYRASRTAMSGLLERCELRSSLSRQHRWGTPRNRLPPTRRARSRAPT